MLANKTCERVQRLINLEIPVLVRSLKSSNQVLGWETVQMLPECAANPLSRLNLISRPVLVVDSVLMQSLQLGSVGWGCTEPVV